MNESRSGAMANQWHLPAVTAALLVAGEEGAFVELTAGVVT
jgi:hypothetical protein